MINVGLVFGEPLIVQAARAGVPALHQANPVWLPLMFAGFAIPSVYCGHRLTVNATWGRFSAAGTGLYWGLALLMALCWFGSVEVYGIAAGRLGPWGPVLGWPIFLATSIITANLWGVITGEWRHAAAGAQRLMLAGLSLLV
jgi:L-rhamnose-H+ transport protein